MSVYEEIREKMNNANAILITASNGLSISEGINLFKTDENFLNVFSDFYEKYGLKCILQGMGDAWPSDEERWSFWARLINKHINEYIPSKIMKDLKEIVKGKDYFIVTSNGENHFEKAGFDERKIYEVEGSWAYTACSCDSGEALYSTLEIAKEIDEGDKKVPLCPKCQRPLKVTMELPDSQIHRRGYKAFNEFLTKYRGKNVVVIELGIGWRNELIKGPVMRIVEREKNFFYITINYGEVYIIPSIQARSFGIDGTIEETLKNIINR